MERTFRCLRVLNRHFSKPYRVAGLKNSAAVNTDDLNLELVNAFNQDINAGGAVPVFRRALLFPNRVAVQDEVGIYTYTAIHKAAVELSKEIDKLLCESRQTIAYLSSNDASHVITQWAIWMTGNIAVPLTSIHPPEMLKYFIEDSLAALVICSQEHEKTIAPIAQETKRNFLVTTRDQQITAQLYQSKEVIPKVEDVGRENSWYGENDALIIYTSGTTSKPKGVIWTHQMLSTQIAALHTAWRYSATDVVLHTLPLHHIHGQLNSMNATLAAGARLRMLPSFATHTVWARLIGMGEREDAKVSVFHGVPAMYARLAAAHETMFPDAKTAAYVKHTLSKMRLMCAGSAPLPSTLFHKWEEISGQRLLERYGMSEVGMALSNPYRPVEQRTVSCVGQPLPGVSARIAAADDNGKLVPLVTVECPLPDLEISLERLGLLSKDYEESVWERPTVTQHAKPAEGGCQGELLLKGPNVFTTYYNRTPKLEDSDFVDEWFRTGDTAAYGDGAFRILGRTSVDIIKTAGYKVSALQVESALLELPAVADAAVLGVAHDTYGETVAAVVVLKASHAGAGAEPHHLKGELAKKLAPYQVPRKFLVVDKMPRNAMGKLDKKEIRRLYGKDFEEKK